MNRCELLEHDWFPRPLPSNVQIGEGSWLYSSFALVHYRSDKPVGLRVGRDSGLYNGTFLDLGPEGEVDIGDYCAIVGAIISSNSRVCIGDYSFIAHEVLIADDLFAVPPDSQPPGQLHKGRSGDIMIGRNVWIGARAIILGASDIGEGAVIGAGSVVCGCVPPYCIAAGNPLTVREIRR